MRTGGSLSVGAFSRPAAAYIGGGGDFTQFLYVFSDDGTSGSYVDNTDAAKSSTNSTFSLFQSPTAGHVAYIGNQITQFPAILFNIASSGSFGTGSDDGIWEYYGSSGWTSVAVMATSATADGQYASNVFQRSGREYVRFDVDSMNGDWVTSSVNSQSAYWVRYRLLNNISSIPTIEQVM